jgi:uncharacterized membrane protein YkvA (DUF1232 family)
MTGMSNHESSVEPTGRDRNALRRTMKDLLRLLPNLVRLLVGLMRDRRVSRSDKAILAGTILYVVAPIDFIPDMIPFIGQIDDTYLVAVALLRMLGRADGAVVAAHWRGEMDIKRLVDTLLDVTTVLLPPAVRNALTAKIDVNAPRSLRMVRGRQDEPRDAAGGK